MTPPPKWHPATFPPSDSRRVVLRFDDDGSRDCEGFYVGSWYKSELAWRQQRAVHPVMWREKGGAE